MPKINEPNFLVTRDFVEAALETRYQEVKDIWGCEASESLWEQFLDVILDCGSLSGTPSYIVDNYLVNGAFIRRIDEEEYVTDEAWEAFCEYNCFIYNNEYALQ